MRCRPCLVSSCLQPAFPGALCTSPSWGPRLPPPKPGFVPVPALAASSGQAVPPCGKPTAMPPGPTQRPWHCLSLLMAPPDLVPSSTPQDVPLDLEMLKSFAKWLLASSSSSQKWAPALPAPQQPYMPGVGSLAPSSTSSISRVITRAIIK